MTFLLLSWSHSLKLALQLAGNGLHMQPCSCLKVVMQKWSVFHFITRVMILCYFSGQCIRNVGTALPERECYCEIGHYGRYILLSNLILNLSLKCAYNLNSGIAKRNRPSSRKTTIEQTTLSRRCADRMPNSCGVWLTTAKTWRALSGLKLIATLRLVSI